MDLPLGFYAITIFAILLTGFSKSGFGGGLGVMSVPMMSVFVAPQFAAAVLMPILIVMDILIVRTYRKTWSAPVLLTLLPGAVVGLVLGAILFNFMDVAMIKLAIGILAMIFVAQFLLGTTASTAARPRSLALGSVLGALSGFASFIAHAGGPPVKGYLLRQGLDKTNFVGTNTLFFFALNAIKTLAYGAVGTMSLESLTVSATVAPVLFIGVLVGRHMHAYVDQALFIKIVYGALALTGAKLISDSLPMLLA